MTLTVPIRFSDCDMMGHVNNACFFSYMEEARVAYFAKIPELDFIKQGSEPLISLILAEATCAFKSPAHLGETIDVSLSLTHMGKSSFVLEYELKATKDQRLVGAGKTVMVLYDYQNKKSVIISDELKAKLQANI